MKTLTLISFLLLGVIVIAQDNTSIAIYQDFGLGIGRDDGHGNSGFTTDITIKFLMNGYSIPGKNNKFIGYTRLGPIFEYAALEGGRYVRYGAEGGFTFTELYLWNTRVELTPLVSYGFIERGFTVRYWEFGLNFGLPVSPHVKFVALATITQAKDLAVLWGPSAKKWRKNFGIGLEIVLFE